MHEKYKIPVILGLLAVSVILTYICHAVLGLGTTFTHFFYIPIILTALWWEQRSIPVALFLGGLIIVSSLLFRPLEITFNDYFRALMFIVIAIVATHLSIQLKGQQRELSQERDRAQKYLDVAGVMLMVVNADETVGLINRRGCSMVGCREEEILGRNWFDQAIPEKHRTEARKAFYRFIQGDLSAFDGEDVILTRRGEERIISWQNTALTDEAGRVTGILCSGKDVTCRRQAEDALVEANEEANLYLDIMVHDINNANAVTLGYAELLGEMLDGKQRQMVGKLRSGICRSIEIIQNVSTIRRLRDDDPGRKIVDLDAVIRAEISQHPEANITYEGDPLFVSADDLVQEIFTNLVGNSVKFGGPDVEVTISTGARGNQVEVAVADTGPGIPDPAKPLLFSRFHRGKSKKSGKGLGLYIVRMLVERYGGRISAEDRVSGRHECGVVFRFTLPRADSRAPHALSARGQGHATLPGYAAPNC